MSSSVLVLLLAAAAQAARPACEPLDQRGFRDLALLLRSGVDRGDNQVVHTVLSELDARLPCLTFAPEPHSWAEVLALRAVVAYAAKEDWETPMAASLRIWPGVDRVVSSRHPLATWEPPDATEPLPAEARHAQLYIDGLPGDALPGPGSLTLVQRTDGTWWNSVLVTPESGLPEGWITQPVEPPPHVAVRTHMSLGAMGVTRFQRAEFKTDWVQDFDAAERPAGTVGGAARLVSTFRSPFGFLVSTSGSPLPDSPGLDLHAAAAWAPGPLVVGLGAGTTSAETFEGPPRGSDIETSSGLEEIHHVYMLQYLGGEGRVRLGQRWRWEIGATGGAGASVRRWAADVALGLPRERGLRWEIELGMASVTGRFSETNDPRRTIMVGNSRTWLGLGWTWGDGA